MRPSRARSWSRSALCAARPSRPAPQTPTRRPARSEKRTGCALEARRDAVVGGGFQPPVQICGRGERADHVGAAPSVVAREKREGGGRLGALAHALERLVLLEAQQLGEAVRLPRLVEQVAPE